MTEQMPDLIYASISIPELGDGEIGGWTSNLAKYPSLPGVSDTEYLKRSHVEATTVPKAELRAAVKHAIEYFGGHLIENHESKFEMGEIQIQKICHEVFWKVGENLPKSDSVPRDKVEALIEAATTKYQCSDEKGGIYMALNDDDINEAIRSLEDKG